MLEEEKLSTQGCPEQSNSDNSGMLKTETLTAALKEDDSDSYNLSQHAKQGDNSQSKK